MKARLLARLAADPALPGGAKIALGAAVLSLASPVDLVPDVLPVLGYVDDILLAAILVDGILDHVDRALVHRHWPGKGESLDRLARLARAVAVWVPRGLQRRVFAGGGG